MVAMEAVQASLSLAVSASLSLFLCVVVCGRERTFK